MNDIAMHKNTLCNPLFEGKYIDILILIFKLPAYLHQTMKIYHCLVFGTFKGGLYLFIIITLQDEMSRVLGRFRTHFELVLG